jgi:hypothetical protein
METGRPLTINVGGNYTQGPAGTLALGIGGLTGSQYDRGRVGGNITLSGTLLVFSLNGFHPSAGDEFAIERSNGTRSGIFAHLDDSLFDKANIPRQLLVAPNGVDLVYLGTPGPPVVPVIDPTTEQLTALFEIPFSGANIQKFNLDDRMTQIQRGFVAPPRPAPLPPPTGKEAVGKEAVGKEAVEKEAIAPVYQPGPRWGVWANGWGDFVNIDDSAKAGGYRFTTGGFSAGIDYLFTDHLAVGLFGGYSHTWSDLRPGSIDVDSGRGGVYATYFNPTGWWFNAGHWGGYNSYSTSRHTVLGLASGSTEGSEVSTFGEAGYNIYWGKLTFGPIASVQYTAVHISGFTEHR